MESMDVPASVSTWPPPIYIIDLSAWPVLDRIINDRYLHINSIQVYSEGLIVTVSTSDDFLRLSSCLRRSSTRFRTYYPAEVNELHQVVIRHLPIEYDLELYHRDLVCQGIPVRELHRILRCNRIPYNMVMALVDEKPEGHAIYSVKTVSGFEVSVETPMNVVCVRCGLFGHEEYYCAYPEKLLPLPSIYYSPPEPSTLSIAAPISTSFLALEASGTAQDSTTSTALEISEISSSSAPNPAPLEQPAQPGTSKVPRIDYESFFNLFEFLRSIDLKELDTVADKIRNCRSSLIQFVNVYDEHRTLLKNINEFMKDMESPY